MVRFDKSHAEFISLSWIVHNVQNIENERYGGIIKVEQIGDLTICIYTDSKRMAMLRYHENCPLEIGYYKIVKKSKTDLFLEKFETKDYPNWQPLLPEKWDRRLRRWHNGVIGDFMLTKDTIDSDLCFIFGHKCCLPYEQVADLGKIYIGCEWQLKDVEDLAMFEAKPVFEDKEEKERKIRYFKYSLLMCKLRLLKIEDLEGCRVLFDK